MEYLEIKKEEPEDELLQENYGLDNYNIDITKIKEEINETPSIGLHTSVDDIDSKEILDIPIRVKAEITESEVMKFEAEEPNIESKEKMEIIDELPGCSTATEEPEVSNRGDLCLKEKKGFNNIDNHFPKKYHQCPMCGEKFTRIDTFYRHLKIHDKVEKYKCEVCSKNFINKGNLIAHMKIHTDAFRCEVCSRNFTRQSNLNAHMKTHSGVKDQIHTKDTNHHCPTCGFGFRRKKDLVKHMNSHRNRHLFK